MVEVSFRSDIQVDLIDHMGSDDRIVQAARASTGNDEIPLSKKNGLIRYLVRERHTSPLEHCVVTVRVEAPIFVAREWMRHRTQSYNELSMRFAEASPEFYTPPFERPLINAGSGAHPKLMHSPRQVFGVGLPDEGVTLPAFVDYAHTQSMENSWRAYQLMLDNGVAAEVARNVLPVGTYSTFYATANLNNWFKFLDLRDGRNGAPQWEIVQGAVRVGEILAGLFPVAYGAWQESR